MGEVRHGCATTTFAVRTAYNFARRLKTLGGRTSYEFICKNWTSEPGKFILNPIYQMPGPDT